MGIAFRKPLRTVIKTIIFLTLSTCALAADSDITPEERGMFAILNLDIHSDWQTIQHRGDEIIKQFKAAGDFSDAKLEELQKVILARDHLRSEKFQTRLHSKPPGASADSNEESRENPSLHKKPSEEDEGFQTINSFNQKHLLETEDQLFNRYLGLKPAEHTGIQTLEQYFFELAKPATPSEKVNPQWLTPALYEFHLQNIDTLAAAAARMSPSVHSEDRETVVKTTKAYLTKVALGADIPLAFIFRVAQDQKITIDAADLPWNSRIESPNDLVQILKYPWSKEEVPGIFNNLISYPFQSPYLTFTLNKVSMALSAYSIIDPATRANLRSVASNWISLLLRIESKKLELIENPKMISEFLNVAIGFDVLPGYQLELAALEFKYDKPSFPKTLEILKSVNPIFEKFEKNLEVDASHDLSFVRLEKPIFLFRHALILLIDENHFTPAQKEEIFQLKVLYQHSRQVIEKFQGPLICNGKLMRAS